MVLPEPVEYNRYEGRCPLRPSVKVGWYGNDAVGDLGPTCSMGDRCPLWRNCPVQALLDACDEIPSRREVEEFLAWAKRRGYKQLWRVAGEWCNERKR